MYVGIAVLRTTEKFKIIDFDFAYKRHAVASLGWILQYYVFHTEKQFFAHGYVEHCFCLEFTAIL